MCHRNRILADIQTNNPATLHLANLLGNNAENCSRTAFALRYFVPPKGGSIHNVLMDSAHDARETRAHGLSLGHVPILDTNPRRSAQRKQEKAREAKARRAIGYTLPETQRYAERSTVDRVNGLLEDEFGARNPRGRGHLKPFCHLVFGVLALTVSQLVKLQV